MESWSDTLERFHRTAKASVNLFIYYNPEALSDALDTFVDYYNYRRYHETLGNVLPQGLWRAGGKPY